MFRNIQEKKENLNLKRYYLELALISARISRWANDKDKFLNYYKYFHEEAKKL